LQLSRRASRPPFEGCGVHAPAVFRGAAIGGARHAISISPRVTSRSGVLPGAGRPLDTRPAQHSFSEWLRLSLHSLVDRWAMASRAPGALRTRLAISIVRSF